ncbi:MAG: cation transporter, partial [Nitrospinota bacterium]
MSCAEEAQAIEKVLAPLRGVEAIEFDLLRGVVLIRHRPEGPQAQDLIRAIESQGFQASPVLGTPRVEVEEAPWWRWLPLWASGAALLGGLVLYLLVGHGPARWAYLAAVLIGLPPIALRGMRAVRRLRLDMHVLMSVAITSAVLIGEWFEAATLAFLFSLSLWLEGFSLGRVRRAIRSLVDLSPRMARV